LRQGRTGASGRAIIVVYHFLVVFQGVCTHEPGGGSATMRNPPQRLHGRDGSGGVVCLPPERHLGRCRGARRRWMQGDFKESCRRTMRPPGGQGCRPVDDQKERSVSLDLSAYVPQYYLASGYIYCKLDFWFGLQIGGKIMIFGHLVVSRGHASIKDKV